MERVKLRYPNGRIHEAIIERDTPLEPGDEFEMHGRRWQAIERGRQRASRLQVVENDEPMLCTYLGPLTTK
jgi:hypothetical protein